MCIPNITTLKLLKLFLCRIFLRLAVTMTVAVTMAVAQPLPGYFTCVQVTASNNPAKSGDTLAGVVGG